MTHALKTWTEFYEAVDSGDKTFEVRKYDRPFKVGDDLLLQEWDKDKKEYTGRELKRRIIYILNTVYGKPRFGIEEEYCIMSLKEIENY